MHFDTATLALCTHYSWIGVSKGSKLGVENLHLYYNRHVGLLSPQLLTFEVDGQGESATRSDLPLAIEETDGRGFIGKICFADADIVCYHATLDSKLPSSVDATVFLPETNPRLARTVTYRAKSRRLTIAGRTPRTDGRDPDLDHPITLSLMIPKAFTLNSVEVDGKPVARKDFSVATDGSVRLVFAAQAAGFVKEQTFIMGVGEGPTAGRITNRMARITQIDSKRSYASSRRWLGKALDEFTFEGVAENCRLHYAKAAYQLISNTKAPRGRIKRLAAFPNRATYSSHYLWDACFTNLGVSQFSPKRAEGFLRVICENQEADGKIPQFICATWNRPNESQPPLIAWSAWRLYEAFGNEKLLKSIYKPLCRMADWWFANRDEDGDGVMEYLGPLESGWDNSPRFDKGRIAAVDLNAYLNREMRILARMAPIAGKPGDSAKWERRANEHADRVYARLMDTKEGVFYDRLVDEDCLVKILTPASFTPMPEGEAHRMITKYLIAPEHFFGAHPFPTVAYSDKVYEAQNWWRGPIWPNIAWKMTEVLRDYGFQKEHAEAVKRLVEMMIAGDDLAELYNSSTGATMGAEALCWTASVFMELAREYSKQTA